MANIGYNSNQEYLDDSIKMVKMLIDYYEENFLSDVEIKQSREFIEEEFLLSNLFISYRMKNTKEKIFLPAYHIKTRFNFNNLEWVCFLISFLFKTDYLYKQTLIKCSGLNKESTLNYETVLKIFYFTEDINTVDDIYNKLVNLKFKMESLCFSKGSMEIDENIFNFLISGEKKIEVNGVEVYIPDIDSFGTLPIRERIAKKIFEISKLRPKDKQFCFFLHGEDGIGKKTLAKRASELMVKGTIIIDLKFYCSLRNDVFYKLIYSPLREALIIDGSICLDHFEVFSEMTPQKYEYLEFLMENIPKFSRDIFILSNNNFSKIPASKSIMVINIPIEKLSYKENFLIWQSYLKKLGDIIKVSSREIANKFHFTPLGVASTANSLKSLWYWKGCKQLKAKDLYKCAYENSISKISNKSTLIKAKYTWDELVLDEKEKDMIRRACNQVKYRHIVYDEWGMDSRVLYGRGLSLLFAGPPGTGKTMAAQVVANELGLEIYKADLSQIVSKYIGETEKNLNELFNEAKKSNVILFFDETDAILGKRTQVKDAHDKNANLETSFLLQKMEEYDGITIMTTNYLENIDRAFFRRISYVVHFAFPNEFAREKIWRNMFPPKVPLSPDIDFKYLAKNFEISGGNIKNAAVNAAFMAANGSGQIKMEEIIKALVDELKKQGKNPIKEDLGEYSYLY